MVYNYSMVIITLTMNYFKWHYALAFVDIFHIWVNMTTFVFNFFSIPIMVRTFFSPWKRLRANRETQSFDLFDLLSTHFVNLIMRIVGAMMRAVLIIIGLLAVIFAIVGGFVFLVVWIFMPLIVILLCAAGTHLVLLQ